MNGWSNYWKALLDRERLNNKVAEMDELDTAQGKEKNTEAICKGIYEKYFAGDEDRLKFVRDKFLSTVSSISNAHLSSNRVKTIDSILRKVITKRYEAYDSRKNPYAHITDDVYQEIITDLVGIRVILSYRGGWKNVHKELTDLFELKEKSAYDNGLIPHEPEKNLMAEWPKAYYASKDDISEYIAEGLDTKPHKKGYRSIHYTISFMNTYIELQVRTIYDEAWSDVDHRYVYKQEANPSSEALTQLSLMLCQLTNLSNDIGERMKAIFEGDKVSRNGDSTNWVVSAECKEFFVDAIERLDKCKNSFVEMNEQMIAIKKEKE